MRGAGWYGAAGLSRRWSVAPAPTWLPLVAASTFAVTIAITRATTYLWDQRESTRPHPGQDSTFGVHHGRIGIAVAAPAALLAGLASEEAQQRWSTLAVAVGAAVALDEVAMAVEGEDVYWEREWVPLTEVALASAASIGLAGRMLVAGLDAGRC